MSVQNLSLVVSVYNEEEVLPQFWQETKLVLDELKCTWEVIFVNDGSTDASQTILQDFSQNNRNIKVVSLSRNFGHEAAMLAGIDTAVGDAVICLDADLQHPPALIPAMLEEYSKGNRIIHMSRTKNESASITNKICSTLFYRLLNLISPEGFVINASDFFLLDKKVCDILQKRYRERSRFLRGIIQIIGFPRTTIEFTAPARPAGISKYDFWQLFNASITALATFSRLPLRMGIVLGIILGIFSLVVGVYSIAMKITGQVTPGYTTIVVLVSFLSAAQLFILGIIGEYIGFVFDEVKRRPIYIIDTIHGGERVED